MKRIIVLLFFFTSITALHADNRLMTWDAVPGARGYLVQIKDAEGKILISEERKEPNYRISLPSGRYQYRVTALNVAGQPNTSSEWSDFEIRIVSAPRKAHEPYSVLFEEKRAESIRKEEDSKEPLQWCVRFMPGVLIPSGVMGSLFDTGYGLTVTGGIQNLFIPKFEVGIFSGLFYIPGNEKLEIDYGLSVPFGLYSGYNYEITEKIDLFPFLRLGGSYTNMSYLQNNAFESDVVLDPLMTLGVAGLFDYAGYSFSTGISGTLLYEEEGIVPYAELFMGIGFIF
ncbi:MAG: hypothetical protein PF637_05315 [Spirochaetes bacterium]|jgi:hypothetical protein|nr:hypothetical protein [Spirochaetota bacterium]